MKTISHNAAMFLIAMVLFAADGMSQSNFKKLMNELTPVRDNRNMVLRSAEKFDHHFTDLDPFPEIKDTSVARKQIQLSAIAFQVGGSAMPLKAAEITCTAIATLSTAVLALNCGIAGCTSTLAGVRIIYGLRSTTQVLYYQPVLFGSNTPSTCGGVNQCTQSFTICSEGGFYKYDNSKFSLLIGGDLDQKNDEVSAFVNQKKFHLNSQNAYDDFKNTTSNDATGDIEYVVYPLDQIASVCSITNSFILWNAAEESRPKLVKNTLELSTNDVTISPTKGTLQIPPTAVFSDFAHICPISCNTNFSIYVK